MFIFSYYFSNKRTSSYQLSPKKDYIKRLAQRMEFEFKKNRKIWTGDTCARSLTCETVPSNIQIWWKVWLNQKVVWDKNI